MSLSDSGRAKLRLTWRSESRRSETIWQFFMSVIIFFSVLSLLVLVHELGHFLAAKKAGIRVEEFGIGLPPRIIGIRRKETIFSMNLLPFGGFVRLTGENEEVNDEKSFSQKPPLKRGLVLTAGVFCNIFLGFLIFWGLFVKGAPSISEKVVIQEVQTGSVAEQVGIQNNDVILSIDGQVLGLATEVSSYIEENSGKEIAVKVNRDGQELVFSAIPAPQLGIIISNFSIEKLPFFKAGLRALQEIGTILLTMILGIFILVKNFLVQKPVLREIAGPIGIAQMTSQAANMGTVFLFQLIAFLSVNLGFVNFLPLPALDGGRIIFVLFEGLTKKKINPKIERTIHGIGMAALLVFLCLISVQDIIRMRNGI